MISHDITSPMKSRTSKHHQKTFVRGTAMQLVLPTRTHEADFGRILPSAMADLVAQGLFQENGRDSYGKLTYKITEKGRKRLEQT